MEISSRFSIFRTLKLPTVAEDEVYDENDVKRGDVVLCGNNDDKHGDGENDDDNDSCSSTSNSSRSSSSSNEILEVYEDDDVYECVDDDVDDKEAKDAIAGTDSSIHSTEEVQVLVSMPSSPTSVRDVHQHHSNDDTTRAASNGAPRPKSSRGCESPTVTGSSSASSSRGITCKSPAQRPKRRVGPSSSKARATIRHHSPSTSSERSTVDDGNHYVDDEGIKRDTPAPMVQQLPSTCDSGGSCDKNESNVIRKTVKEKKPLTRESPRTPPLANGQGGQKLRTRSLPSNNNNNNNTTTTNKSQPPHEDGNNDQNGALRNNKKQQRSQSLSSCAVVALQRDTTHNSNMDDKDRTIDTTWYMSSTSSNPETYLDDLSEASSIKSNCSSSSNGTAASTSCDSSGDQNGRGVISNNTGRRSSSNNSNVSTKKTLEVKATSDAQARQHGMSTTTMNGEPSSPRTPRTKRRVKIARSTPRPPTGHARSRGSLRSSSPQKSRVTNNKSLPSSQSSPGRSTKGGGGAGGAVRTTAKRNISTCSNSKSPRRRRMSRTLDELRDIPTTLLLLDDDSDDLKDDGTSFTSSSETSVPNMSHHADSLSIKTTTSASASYEVSPSSCSIPSPKDRFGACSISFVEDTLPPSCIVQVFEEALRIVKPGGRIYIVDATNATTTSTSTTCTTKDEVQTMEGKQQQQPQQQKQEHNCCAIQKLPIHYRGLLERVDQFDPYEMEGMGMSHDDIQMLLLSIGHLRQRQQQHRSNTTSSPTSTNNTTTTTITRWVCTVPEYEVKLDD